MSQKTDKFSILITHLITGKIIEYTAEKIEVFGIVSVIETKVSTDYSYADVFVTSQKNTKELTKFLAAYASDLKSLVSKNVKIRKIPNLRFRIQKAKNDTTDVLSLINELSDQYGFNKES